MPLFRAGCTLASARVLYVAYGARGISAGCIGARCIGTRCIGDAQPSRSATAVGCVAQCAARARLDWAKGGLCGGRAAVRCARAQTSGGGGGGVLSMAKGTALFDAVDISGTEAYVR